MLVDPASGAGRGDRNLLAVRQRSRLEVLVRRRRLGHRGRKRTDRVGREPPAVGPVMDDRPPRRVRRLRGTSEGGLRRIHRGVLLGVAVSGGGLRDDPSPVAVRYTPSRRVPDSSRVLSNSANDRTHEECMGLNSIAVNPFRRLPFEVWPDSRRMKKQESDWEVSSIDWLRCAPVGSSLA